MDKPSDTFFKQLRQLASTVERQCDDYSKAVLEKPKNTSGPQVIKKITDLRKDVRQIKESTQKHLRKVEEEGETLTKILSAGQSFLNSQLQKLAEREQYFAQYGYKPYAEVYRSDEKENSDPVKAEEDIYTTTENKPSSSTPSKTRPLVDPNRTPRLEDAGISHGTLQYLNSLQKQKQKTSHHTDQRSVSKKPSDFPPEFEHSGIICTPSLAKSLNADMSYNPDLHAALASPAIFSVAKHFVKEEKLDVPTLEIPASPVFCTPGLKQSFTKVKEEIHDNHPASFTKRPVNIGLFQSSTKAGATGRGIKPSAISRSEQSIRDYMTSDNYIAEEPPEPELTYSLEALSEMTGMYKINPLTKPLTYVKPNSKFTISDKENATPPEPEMLTNRISRIGINQETSGGQDSGSLPRAYGDMPPSPILLGNYDHLK